MKMDRPPYILGIPADLAGCGYHRIIRPMEIMSRNAFSAGRCDPTFLQPQQLAALNPDVVVFQRQYEEAQREQIKAYRATLPSAFFVFEIDDAMSSVPDSSWHKPYMNSQVDANIREAVKLCDAVSVTTQTLAEHMATICEEGTDIRVVPNMLGLDDLYKIDEVRKQISIKPTKKLRIGWCGGIGHGGDLALLWQAMEELRDEVEWVFMGMDPAVPMGVHKTHVGATTPDQYLVSFAALQVDLMVAPLEDNHFNRCKSNLRLIEGGACSYPTIASPLTPYRTKNPPVYGYAHGPKEWASIIRDFMKLAPEVRKLHGQKMRKWVEDNYILDTHCGERLINWMPKGTQIFVPRLRTAGTSMRVLANEPVQGVQNVTDLAAACREGTADIVFMRPGVHLSEGLLQRLAEDAPGDVICVPTNDGGPWGFPVAGSFSPLDARAMEDISELSKSYSVTADTVAAGGPLVLLRRSVLNAIGSPDWTAASPEVAILEWSVAAKSRGFKVGAFLGGFVGVDLPQQVDQREIDMIGARIALRWPQQQADDTILRAYRQELEMRYHGEHFTTMPPQDRQNYMQWAEVVDTPGPEAQLLASEWLIKQENAPHIDVRLCFDGPLDPLNIPPGGWIFFIPGTARLAANWKAYLTEAIINNPKADIVYADHDYMNDKGLRNVPDLKPNFDLELLIGRDYITTAMAVRVTTSFIDTIAESSALGEAAEVLLYRYALIRGVDYRDKIVHVPRVLVHMPPEQRPEKAVQKAKLAVAQSASNNYSVTQHPLYPALHDVHYKPMEEADVLVIIPTRDNVEMLEPCISTLLSVTKYSHGKLHVCIINNGSTRKEMLEYLSKISRDQRVTVMDLDVPFNWSVLNNRAIEEHKDDYTHFVLLNDDTRVLNPNWLTEMVGASQTMDAGAIGAKLLFPQGAIQHIGVIAEGGLAGHMHKGLPATQAGQNGIAILNHEATAVTGACMLVSREVIAHVGLFNEAYEQNFNDVEFCRRATKAGYRNIVAIHAELQHFEGVTRNERGLTQGALERIQADGRRLAVDFPDDDVYWNKNLMFAGMMNGAAVAGTDMNIYSFPAPAPTWGVPEKRRILLIGDIAPATAEIRDGVSVYQLGFNGYICGIASPRLQNCGPWDIREAAQTAEVLKNLNPDMILITGIGEAPLQVLQLAVRLGLPVEYRPSTAEATCPRKILAYPEGPCGDAYKTPGACQKCMDVHGSPHGNIGMVGWYNEWFRFFQAPNVRVNLAFLADSGHKDALEAVGYVYDARDRDQAAE